jgi:LCP family protein required for cell wall assembly
MPSDPRTPPPLAPQAEPALPHRGRRWWRYVAWGLPVIVLVLGGLALGAYLFALSQISAGTGDMAARQQRTEAFGWPMRLNDRVNVLLMGVDVTLDNKRRVLSVARADTLALITFDPDRGQIAVLSIPRDTQATIPGFGETKINAAYAYGGPRLTIRTVEALLGVKVHFYIKLGPESFGRIIDAIGGVEVDVEKDMKYTDSWAGYRIDLKKGRQWLNGEQATGYIRYRHDAQGDIGRVERQHKLLMSLVRQLRRPSTVMAAPKLLRVVAENTQTSLTPAEMMTLGFFALRTKDAPLRMHTLPGTFAPLYWEPDVPKVRALVADLFYGVAPEDLTGTPIEVLNASGIPGLGRRVADRVATLGFRTVRLGTSTVTVEVTTIIDRTGRPGVARMLAAAIGKVTIKQEPPSDGASITILVARDAARVVSVPARRRSN